MRSTTRGATPCAAKVDDFVAAVIGNLDNDQIPDPSTDLLRELYERSFTR